jgi:hypothetical protein
MVDVTTKLVVSVSGQSGEAPGEASMKDMAAGGTVLPGKFSGNFDGVVGATTPAAGTFTIVAGSVAAGLTDRIAVIGLRQHGRPRRSVDFRL